MNEDWERRKRMAEREKEKRIMKQQERLRKIMNDRGTNYVYELFDDEMIALNIALRIQETVTEVQEDMAGEEQ